MYQDKKILAIIPARGGSKGLPGKNIKEICGHPLISWTIKQAQKSKFLDACIVSTDDTQIASVSKKYGGVVPFLRPAHLASDTASSFDAVKHTIDFLKDNQNREFDYIVLLEPTSPLREDGDIDKMIELIIAESNSFDSLISIGEVNEHPSIVKKIHNKSLYSFCQNIKQTNRRQDNETAYFPYGVAYIVKTNALLNEKTFYTKKSTFYKIKRYQCYEIDDIYDFLAIENIMKYQWRI